MTPTNKRTRTMTLVMIMQMVVAEAIREVILRLFKGMERK
jgi:hypothetical protein